MDDALYRTMLFDFYGELLTEKQRSYFNLHYNEDLSLAEIAEDEGVSRQSVWENIRRGEECLRRFEEKTGLVARFTAQNDTLDRLTKEADTLLSLTEGKARGLAEQLVKGLQELRHGI